MLDGTEIDARNSWSAIAKRRAKQAVPELIRNRGEIHRALPNFEILVTVQGHQGWGWHSRNLAPPIDRPVIELVRRES